MTLVEKQGNLFNAPQGYYLAHCISNDFSLGAGIAKTFDEQYNMKFKLFRDYGDGGARYVGQALLIDNVFNLVTKENYYDKPTYENLCAALQDMKRFCESINITKLAMPKIGCGLDKLDWDFVKNYIEDTFYDTDIEIVIYTL